MPLSLPPIQAMPENHNQRFILRNDDPNGGDDPDLLITELELLHEGHRKEVYRGTLAEPIEDALYVACKVAYGQNAMRKLRHEAALYQGRLKPLQDAWVPICYGYFVGETDEGLTGCLVLGYCGKALDIRFSYLEHKFKYVCFLRAVRYERHVVLKGPSHQCVRRDSQRGCLSQRRFGEECSQL